jgi:hypothetical protein
MRGGNMQVCTYKAEKAWVGERANGTAYKEEFEKLGWTKHDCLAVKKALPPPRDEWWYRQ